MLSSDEIGNILHAIATGYLDRAAGLIEASVEITDDERVVLRRALTDGADNSARARRLGDALRSLEAPRHLVNECYRVAFYTGDEWMALSANPLFAFFTANRAGLAIDKWIHYFAIYDRHLSRFRGSPAKVLEIGVSRGGGLALLRHYLGGEAGLVGIDVDQAAALATSGRFTVEIGDQADPEFLRRVSDKHGPFDIVIDDGGHTMRQQITSAETLFPLLNDEGVYLVEDCHTSYWPEYGADGGDGQTFVEWVKARIDDLNAYHFSTAETLAFPWQTHLDGIHVYDSVAVLTKHRNPAPFCEISGTKEFIAFDRNTSALHLELLATRDAALALVPAAEAALARAAGVEADAAADVERSRLELQGVRGESVDLRNEVQALRADLESLREEHGRMTGDLLGSWGIIREMRRSRSWRLTAPLRRVRSVARRK